MSVRLITKLTVSLLHGYRQSFRLNEKEKNGMLLRLCLISSYYSTRILDSEARAYIKAMLHLVLCQWSKLLTLREHIRIRSLLVCVCVCVSTLQRSYTHTLAKELCSHARWSVCDREGSEVKGRVA